MLLKGVVNGSSREDVVCEVVGAAASLGCLEGCSGVHVLVVNELC